MSDPISMGSGSPVTGSMWVPQRGVGHSRLGVYSDGQDWALETGGWVRHGPAQLDVTGMFRFGDERLDGEAGVEVDGEGHVG